MPVPVVLPNGTQEPFPERRSIRRLVVSRLRGRAARTSAVTLTGVGALSFCLVLNWAGRFSNLPRPAHLSARLPKCRRRFRFDTRVAPNDPYGFQRDHSAWRLESCVPVSFVPVQERPMPTDTILTIRCPYCMAGIDFRPMIAYKDGRFVCRDCAHTVRPGEPEYRCTCRTCLRTICRVLRA